MALAHPCVFPIALRALVALFPLFGVYDGFIFVRFSSLTITAACHACAVGCPGPPCSWNARPLSPVALSVRGKQGVVAQRALR